MSSPTQRGDLGVGPDVEGAFRLSRRRVVSRFWRDAVGILSRVEPAGRIGHVAEHVRERVFRDVEEERIT